jgi:hypothetical protein
MAKNRKNMSVAIRFGPAIKALLICSLFIASGVGYVWQKSLIADLERHIKSRELALVECRDKNKKLREQLAGLRSPDQMKALLRGMNLGLASPQPAQVVWLMEPAGPRLAQPPLPIRPGPAVERYAARR